MLDKCIWFLEMN